MSLRPSRDFTYVSTLALDVEVDLLCITAMKLLKNVMSCFYRTELENRAKRWPCEVSCERPLTNKLVQNHCFPCDSSHILSLKLDHFFGIVLNFDTSAAKRCNYTWKRTWWVMMSNDFMLVCNSTRWLRHLSFFPGLRHFWWWYNMQRE